MLAVASLVAGLASLGVASGFAQTVINQDTTQNGGVVNTPTDGPTLQGVLQITHSSNSPQLRLQQGATRNSSALVIGSLSGEQGRMLTSDGSILSNIGAGHLGTLDETAVSGGNIYLGLNGATMLTGNSLGTTTVTGNGSRWNNSDGLYVGYHGTGVLNIESGGVVTTNRGYLGTHLGSDGTANVSGMGSEWSNESSLVVGRAGTGAMNVTNGGVVNNEVGSIGNFNGSSGTVMVSGMGTEWNNSSVLYVGASGTGLLNIENGAVVRNTLGYVATHSGSNGIANVIGLGSQWNNSSDLFVGREDTGELNVSDGGLVTSRAFYLGGSATSHLGGTGTVNIGSGGTISVTQQTRIHSGSNIHLQSNGRLVTFGLDTSGGGAFNFTGGTLELTGGAYVGDLTVVAGATLAGNGSVNGDLNLSGNINPGNSPGTLTVTGDLVWNGGGQMRFELGQLSSDLINVTGDFRKGAFGTWNFHFSDAGDFAPGTYTLLTYSNTDFTIGDFSFTTDIAGFGGSFHFGGGGLQFSAVPEPSSLLLVSIGLLFAVRRRRSDTGSVNA